jgi:prepilin-type N-terminal cleavage/methylation domain-containing protein
MGYKSMAMRRMCKKGAWTMRRTRRGDAGFSMVEIMIAMGVIAVALFAVLSMTMHTNTTREDLREMEVAKEAAIRKIDEIRGLPWGSVSGTVVPSVVLSYVTATRAPEKVPGLRYDVSTAAAPAGDPWNTTANNPYKQGKLSVIVHGVHHGDDINPPPPFRDPIRLVDFEVLVEWTGVKGKSHYSMRVMLTKGQQE